MKAMWTRLAQIVQRQGGHSRFKDARFDSFFMRHHKNADELVLSHDGEPLAAVYFTPKGRHPGDLKALMRAIRERTETTEKGVEGK